MITIPAGKGHLRMDVGAHKDVIEQNLRFLEQTFEHMRERGMQGAEWLRWRRDLRAIARRLERDDITVALVGGFSAGKSTLINAFLGEELLPSGATPTTAAGIRITYGPRKELVFRAPTLFLAGYDSDRGGAAGGAAAGAAEGAAAGKRAVEESPGTGAAESKGRARNKDEQYRLPWPGTRPGRIVVTGPRRTRFSAPFERSGPALWLARVSFPRRGRYAVRVDEDPRAFKLFGLRGEEFVVAYSERTRQVLFHGRRRHVEPEVVPEATIRELGGARKSLRVPLVDVNLDNVYSAFATLPPGRYELQIQLDLKRYYEQYAPKQPWRRRSWWERLFGDESRGPGHDGAWAPTALPPAELTIDSPGTSRIVFHLATGTVQFDHFGAHEPLQQRVAERRRALDDPSGLALLSALTSHRGRDAAPIVAKDAAASASESEAEIHAEAMALLPIIRNVTIAYPAPTLQRGIHIIDTPGLQASEEDTAATLKTIRYEADGCLFLYPVEQAGTMSDLQVVRQHLLPEAGQLVFVVTKIDQVDDAAEVAEVLDFLRDKIADATGIEEPVVHGVSARSVFQPTASYDEGHFAAFVDDLVQFIERNRHIIALERTANLQRRLLVAIGEYVVATRAEYDRKYEELRSFIIDDLPSYLRKERPRVQQSLALNTRRLQTVWQQFARAEGAVREAMDRVSGSLEGVTSLAELKRRVESTVQGEIIPWLQQELNGIYGRCGAHLRREAAEVVGAVFADFEKRFVQTYDLEAIGRPAVSVNVGAVAERHIRSLGAHRPAMAEEAVQAAGERMVFGAGAGALFGTFLLPGIGTVIGGVLGGIVGSLFGPKVQEVRARIYADLRQQTNVVLERMQGQLHEDIYNVELLIERAVDDTLRRYIATYNDAVNEIIREHEAEQAEVLKEIENLGRLRGDIEHRLEAVLKTTESLRNVRV